MSISGGRIRNGRFERVEPRCHICREEEVRVRVNELLDWRRVPIAWRPVGAVGVVSFADVLREVNGGRDEADWISHASLRVHVKRHYDLDAIVAHWAAQMDQALRNALDGFRSRKPIE
ncbi:hypothetical protein MINTM020_44720 [Mycobacterium paraintracellulare]|uniref:hypothetical protein n=1 Tax=Mycobacterium paraintracellulare TaxID=1138383 RepID=UPI001926C466|nr:hypothetical protein [Mycobacterium paraintracellulare]BCP12374.1 hypothetical protein MINTM020_44720 [Mycobacterium paraintracellulare]